MKLWIGTSGFQYTEWRGSFYPEDLAPAKMLPYYAERFAATEVNYTFHRIPSPKTIENWLAQTPAHFRFALKAPQKVTHFAKLKNCADTIDYFWNVSTGLGERLGPVLFQLPPQFKKDAVLLNDFVQQLPPSLRAAFEFRSETWLDDEIYEILGQRNCALCLADTEKMSTPPRATANWGYYRLRREDYQPADVARWAEIIRATSGQQEDVFVFFKHEERGMGPQLAAQLQKLFPNET